MKDDIRDRFIASFEVVARQLAPLVDDQVEPAKSAVGDVWDAVATLQGGERLIAPVFAGHGPLHWLGLAHQLENCVSVIEVPSTSPIRDFDTLVLLYAAFIVHDAGMLTTSDGIDEPLPAGWAHQRPRPGHDHRSLRMLETAFSDILKGQKYHWKAFWDNHEKWPKAPSDFAILLLARICQSHGDPPGVWLHREALAEYHSRKDNTIKLFQNCWQEEWATIEPKVLAASAVLSLCDLCDIGKHRFTIDYDPKILGQLLPEDSFMRRQTFLHYIGHTVGTVKFTANQVLVRTACPADAIDGRGFLPFSAGPCRDLLEWGNHKDLENALRESIWPAFNGIRPQESLADQVAWGEIEQLAFADEFVKCWTPSVVTESLLAASSNSARRFCLAIAQPYWWHCHLPGLQKDLKDLPGPPVADHKVVLDLAAQGLPFEEFVDVSIDSTAANANVICATPRSDTDGNDADSFIAALVIAMKLMSRRAGRFHRVRYATKGNTVHADLRKSQLDGYSHSVILCHVVSASRGDPHDYIAMITEGMHRSSIVVVFFGDRDVLKEIADSSAVKNVLHIPLADKCAEYLGRVASNNGTLQVVNNDSPSHERKSPGASAWAVLLAGAPAQTITKMLRRGLESETLLNNETDTVCLLSLMKIIILLDTGPIPLARVERLHSRVFDFLFLKTDIQWRTEQLQPSLQQLVESLLITRGGDVLDLKEPELANEILIETCRDSRMGRLITGLCELLVRESGLSYNIAADLSVDPSFLFASFERFLRFAFTESESLESRLRIGYIVSSRLGKFCSNPDSAENLIQAINAISNPERASKCKDDLCSLIAFQMTYHLACAARLGDSLFDVKILDLLNPWGILGVYECLASAPPMVGQDLRRKYATRVRRAAMQILTHAKTSENSFEAIVAFDIAWYYAIERKNKPFERASKELLDWGAAKGWHEVAQSVRRERAPASQERKLVQRWREFRNRFEKVLNAAPSQFRRENWSDAQAETHREISDEYRA